MNAALVHCVEGLDPAKCGRGPCCDEDHEGRWLCLNAVREPLVCPAPLAACLECRGCEKEAA
jgi:hypothetical protein